MIKKDAHDQFWASPFSLSAKALSRMRNPHRYWPAGHVCNLLIHLFEQIVHQLNINILAICVINSYFLSINNQSNYFAQVLMMLKNTLGEIIEMP